MDDLELCLYDLESFQTILKVSGRSKKCPDHPENVAGLSKILQNHLLCAFFADLIYVLYPESFCDKNLANRKVFAFFDTGHHGHGQWSMVIKVVIIIIIVTHLPFGTARPPPVQIKSIINELIIYLLMIFDRYPLDLY